MLTLRAQLDNLSFDASGSDYAFKMSYDNYLTARDWFRSYVITNHKMPRFDDISTDPNNNFLYQIVAGNLKNNG
ncbi:MAG: hypothetical protein LBE13_00360 [Bacteroidales bacterium]|jgi:hypothetical protein|nr:hypothetical protein [Bacteroidales bacterium]